MIDQLSLAEWKRLTFQPIAEQIRTDHAAAPWWRKWSYWRALWDTRHWK